LLLVLLLFFPACSSDEKSIATTVDGFFKAISSDDVASVADYFPAFAGLDSAERDAYVSMFSGFTGWECDTVQIQGENAVAAVTASSENGRLSLHLPLRYIDKRWVITERTSMRLDIGTVPAQ